MHHCLLCCKQENSSQEQPSSLKNLSVLSTIAAKRREQHSRYASSKGFLIYTLLSKFFYIFDFDSLSLFFVVWVILLPLLKLLEMMWCKLIKLLKSVVKLHFVVLLNFRWVVTDHLAQLLWTWYIFCKQFCSK